MDTKSALEILARYPVDFTNRFRSPR